MLYQIEKKAETGTAGWPAALAFGLGFTAAPLLTVFAILRKTGESVTWDTLWPVLLDHLPAMLITLLLCGVGIFILISLMKPPVRLIGEIVSDEFNADGMNVYRFQARENCRTHKPETGIYVFAPPRDCMLPIGTTCIITVKKATDRVRSVETLNE